LAGIAARTCAADRPYRSGNGVAGWCYWQPSMNAITGRSHWRCRSFWRRRRLAGQESRDWRGYSPLYRGVASALVSRACEIAWHAYDSFRETSLSARAHFLERVAALLLECGEDLVGRAVLETGLPRARLKGNVAAPWRNYGCLPAVVRDGGFIGARIDSALPERRPMPRADLRQRHIALGQWPYSVPAIPACVLGGGWRYGLGLRRWLSGNRESAQRASWDVRVGGARGAAGRA